MATFSTHSASHPSAPSSMKPRLLRHLPLLVLLAAAAQTQAQDRYSITVVGSPTALFYGLEVNNAGQIAGTVVTPAGVGRAAL